MSTRLRLRLRLRLLLSTALCVVTTVDAVRADDAARGRDRTEREPHEHWAFRPLLSTSPPASAPSSSGGHVRGAIDRFVAARLAERGLEPAPEADRRTLIRRLWLDVLGLPPPIERVEAFVRDETPDAWVRLVDEALASPRFGERQAQHWLDIVRYADTHGFEVNTPRENAWPYRDWVIGALNRDLPYDRFVLEQLAGDVLDAGPATGFLVAAAALLPGQIGKDDASKRLARQDELDEIIQGTSATFLGLTIGCARCHDHEFDPITQRDYYTWQAFFAGVDYGDRPIDDEASRERAERSRALGRRIAELQRELGRFEPIAFTGRTLRIDESDPERVEFLRPANGPGVNPAGTARGYRDDVGSADRAPNLSGGRYTWWDNSPGEDVVAYRPGVAGRYRVWISWGVHGSGVHTRDARYVLDPDGELTARGDRQEPARGDQREIARVDQHYPAGVGDGESAKVPRWSGLLDVGAHDLTESSAIVVRGGETGSGITADAIVLQEIIEEEDDDEAPRLPRLRAPVNPRSNVERFTPTVARFVRFTTLATVDDDRHEPCIDELEVWTSTAGDPVNVALASRGAKVTSSGDFVDLGRHELEFIHDGRYGNERSWISDRKGGGHVTIELAKAAEIDRVVWGRDRTGGYADRLAVRYRIEVSSDGEAWRLVAGSEDRAPIGAPFDPARSLAWTLRASGGVDPGTLLRRLEALGAEKARLDAPRMVFGGKFREPDPTFVLRRGDPEQPTDEVDPAIPAVFREPSTEATGDAGGGSIGIPRAAARELGETERRLALGRWIASPENPLTARVMVNRIWLSHFGHGLVETPSDFGRNGAPPSHPRLLDWLAGDFIRGGWSMKRVHRAILLSSTYRQSSRIDPRALGVDRGSRWLWRFPARRLEAEAIRDSMLAASGELNLAMGGPGFDFFRSRGGLNGFPPVEDFGPDGLRRMIYAHKVRMESVPVFGAFDCPDAGQATPVRSRSTTAIQALELFNSPFVLERAERLAERVRREVDERAAAPGAGPPATAARVALAFRYVLGREPTDVELRASVRTTTEHGLATLCRALLNSNEFLFLH